VKTLILAAGVKERAIEDQAQYFEEMYVEHFSRMYRYIHYRVGERQTAEDLTSMLFERALTRLDLYNADKGGFSTWLFSIARHIIANHYRSQRRKPVSMPLGDGTDIEDPTSNPEENLLEQDQQWVLNRHLLSLPEKEQEIIALRFGAGFSNREIGKLIGLSESNVGTILHRAIQKLRKTFQNEGWDV
jgi:RNA polymerase sigma-70 factor (ECF subfamily)